MQEPFTAPQYVVIEMNSRSLQTRHKRITRRECITTLQKASIDIQCLLHPKSLYGTHAPHGYGP